MCQAVLGQAADLCTKELMKDEHFGIGSLEGLTQWVLLVHTYGTVGQGMASQFLILQNYFRYPDAVMFQIVENLSIYINWQLKELLKDYNIKENSMEAVQKGGNYHLELFGIQWSTG